MSTWALDDTLLPKRPRFRCSAATRCRQVAYATQEILLVLVLAGSAAMAFTGWIAAAVVLLMVIVVASYRQTVTPISQRRRRPPR